MDRYVETRSILDSLASRCSSTREADLTPQKVKHEIKESRNVRILLALSGTRSGFDGYLKELKGLIKEGCSFDVALSRGGERIYSIGSLEEELHPIRILTSEDMIDCNKILGRCDFILAPMVTQHTAIKLSLGMQDELIPLLLWNALWIGMKVYIDFLNAALEKTAKNLYMQEIIHEHIERIKSMGALEISVENMKETILNTKKDLEPSKAASTGGVITERDIITLGKGEIMVGKDTIITPLARDMANKLNIKIIKERRVYNQI